MSDTSPPRLVAQRFLIEHEAGRGGMGTVYRATDTLTGRPVALKLMHRDTDERAVERFFREARLLAELDDPGIVAHVASGRTEEGRPYIAMTWLEGEPLAERLRRQRLTVTEVVALLHGIARPLAAAHKHGVVHRDLKPGNLYLRDGDIERVALLDFGIARTATTSGTLTQNGVIIGTPRYMAPEQASGRRDLGPSADIFALGCIAFECLTGEPPFAGDHLAVVLAKILLEEPPDLRTLRPDVPEPLVALIARMLHKDPDRRPRDAVALAALLARLADPALGDTVTLAASAPERLALLRDGLQLVCVILAAAPETLEHDKTLPEEELDRHDARVRAIRGPLVAAGAHVDALASGALVATFSRAHEAATDQAVQAAHGAAQIKERWPGALVVLTTGRGSMRGGRPLGEALDRAGHLLRAHQAATAGQDLVVIDEVTAGLLETRLRTARLPAGGFAILRGEASLDEARRLLGRPTPCVGRDAELRLLETTLSACREEPSARALLITGPAGTGKSRLRHEFMRRVRELGGELSVMTARGELVGATRALMAGAIRGYLGLHEDDELEACRAALRRRVAARLPEPAARHTAAFLGEFCGAPFPDEESPTLSMARRNPRTMGAQVTQALIDFLRAECEAAPVLLILEDLHWGDALTVDLCGAALSALSDQPFLVLAFARPEVTDVFPRLWSKVLTMMRLQPLSAKAGERLVRHVLGKDAPAELVAQIVERSAGNALYLEELIRAAAAGERDNIPGTVLAMLQGRITLLEPEAGQILRAASVFGERFTADGVGALLGTPPQAGDVERWITLLGEREIVVEQRRDGLALPAQYRFRHGLMRDAAYSLLTEEDRQLGHRLAGRHIEALGEDGDDHGEALARHYYEGQAWERALLYTTKAAEKAAAAYANQDALHLYQRAREICVRLGEPWRAAEVLQQQAMVHLQAGDFARARSDLREIVPIAVEREDRPLQGMALTLVGMVEHFQHEFGAAERTLRAALAIGEAGSPSVQFGASMWLGATYMMFDRHAEAAPLLDAAERLAGVAGDPFQQAWWGIAWGSFFTWRGAFADALAALDRWSAAVETSRQVVLSLWARWLGGLASAGAGDYQHALSLLDEALQAATRAGEPLVVARVLNTIGWIHGELGDVHRSLAWNTRGVDAARQIGVPDPEILSNALLNVADNLLSLQRFADAEDTLRSVEAIVERARREDPYLLWRYSLHLFSTSAELCLARGEHARALAYADQCLGAAEASKSLKYVVKARRLRGQAFAATGRTGEAVHELSLARELAHELGNPPELWRTMNALGSLHQVLGHLDDARELAREAAEIVERTARRLTDAPLREALLRSHGMEP